MTSTLAPSDPSTAVHPGHRPRLTPVRVMATAGLFLVAVAATAVLSTALFTATTSVDGNTFTSGTIDISSAPVSALVSVSAMVPGDQDTAALTVTNSGSLDLRYAVESTTTEDVLAALLVLTVKTGVTVCDDANWAATGTTLYSGPLGSVAGVGVIGAPAAGADAGDRVLAPGLDDDLCVNVTLPLASTGGEGLTTTATLEFLAEQTANNP